MPKAQAKTNIQPRRETQADTQAKPLGPKPTLRLYCVKGDGDKASWTPIGAAWPNKDGMGFSLSCDAIPLTGRLVLRVITERAESAGGQS